MSEGAEPREDLAVLVVDGDRRAREGLCAALERRGWWIREAGGVAEACRLLEASPADVVLVDDALPDGSALDLARAGATVMIEQAQVRTEGPEETPSVSPS